MTAHCKRGGSSTTGRLSVSIPSRLLGGNGDAIATGLNILLFVLLGGSLLLFIWALIGMTLREPVREERLLQLLLLLAGGVVALGAESAGVTFATSTVNSLIGAGPWGEAFIKPVALIFPGGAGAFVGFCFIRIYNKNAHKGKRFMCFLGMLTAIAFVLVLAKAASIQGVFLGAAAIPNASFVVGLIVGLGYFAKSPSDPVAEASRRSGFRHAAQ